MDRVVTFYFAAGYNRKLIAKENLHIEIVKVVFYVQRGKTHTHPSHPKGELCILFISQYQ
jgi:hypothetical protein